jgi:hypothetical protein
MTTQLPKKRAAKYREDQVRQEADKAFRVIKCASKKSCQI